jgi:hypothetical protein
MRWWLLAAAIILADPAAGAGELTRPLVKSGDWAAIEHASVETAAPTMCLAIDPAAGLALRADAAGTELMVANRHWDLPEAVHWTIKVTMGSGTRSFSVTSNTTNTVSAAINPSIVPMLLDEMGRAPSMRVVVGETTPLKVSLAGSPVVLNAFRTCARIG